MDISFVIPALHEFPQLVHTLFSIQNEMSDLPYSYEIIIVENGEEDPYTPRFLTYFRVPIKRKLIRYFFEPTPCGPAARMAGVREAQGEHIIFIDGHVELGKNTVPLLLETMREKDAGSVHGTTVKTHWVKNGGGHYRMFGNAEQNLNNHFHGAYCWSVGDEPYRVVGATLAYVLFRRDELLKLRGYHPECRFYPHPEGYLPLKYLMFDRQPWLHPKALHFHSNVPLGGMKTGYKTINKLVIDIKGDPYTLAGNDNVIRNTMICAYTLGGEKWLNLVHDHWGRRVRSKYVLDGIRDDAQRVSEEEHRWVQDNAVRALDEVLTNARKKGIRGMENWFNPIGPDPLR